MGKSRKDGAKDSIFQNRIKNLIKESNYNKDSFCESLSISTNTYEKYMRTGANLPSLDKVKDMAELLNVDVGYLLGDYNYPRISELKSISALSNYTEKSVEVLNEVSETEPTREIFEKILQDENFIRLLLQTYRYSTSYNRKIKIEDDTEVFKIETISDPVVVSGLMKKSSTDLFNRIIESIYESNLQTSKDIAYYSRIKRLYTEVHELKALSETPLGKKKLIKYIENELSYIAKYVDSNALILNFKPQEILDNIDSLYESVSE